MATIRQARSDRKTPLTFDSYAEFRALSYVGDVDAVVSAGD